MADVLPGYQTPIYGYEGIYPGPTIRARKGRTAMVKQTNTLSFDSNVHLHGGYVPAEFDGHPMDVIAPGASFDYKYPNDQDAAFLWYHDHAHGRTARTLYYGLVGTYVLHDDREEDLDLPLGEYDVPLVIQDHAFNKDGSFRYAENVDVGFFGDTILVNGAIAPRMAVDRRKYRFRILNASNARGYRLVLGGGREMVQIASDGGLLEKPVRRKEIPIFPAERVEVVIDFAKFTPGHAARAAQRGRRGDHDARSCASTSAAAAARRTSACPGGCGGSPTCPSPTRRGAWTSRCRAARASSGRSTAAGSTRRASTSGRGSARRRSGSSRTRPTACTRCTCTGCSSASGSAPRASSTGPTAAGRTRWRAARRARRGAALVRPVRRPLRVPLPQPGARRQGDDAAAGGGRVKRRITPARRPRSRWRPRPRRSAPTPRSRAWTTLVWDKPAVTINAGEKVTWTFDGTVLPHNVLARRAQLAFRSPARAAAARAVSRTFDTPGVYDYVCEVHSTTMIGRRR